MLTWPCVAIEWNTPAIQTVEVSDASSGTRRSPVRRIRPCGRRTPSSLALSTTWRLAPVKNEWTRPPSRSTSRISPPKRARMLRSPRSRHARHGRLLNSVDAGGSWEPSPPSLCLPAASGSERTRSTRARSSAELGLSWSGRKKPKNPRVILAPGSSRTRASCRTAIECSCWRRRPGSILLAQQRWTVARAAAHGMELERVGRKAHAPAKRAHERPRMEAAHRQVLAHGQGGAALGMNEGRVVDVVAHVVLVEAHGAVMSERQILRMNQIDRLAGGTDVLDGHVPEPRGCRARQHE